MKSLIFVLWLVVSNAPTPPARWQNPALWPQLRVGQSDNQVRRLLGDPAAEESTRTLEAWYYQDVPNGDERPSVGRLIFRRTPQGTVLKEFNEPDWSRVPDWQMLNDDYRRRIAASQTPERPSPRQFTAVSAAPSAPEPAVKRPARPDSRPAAAVAEPEGAPKPDSTAAAGRYFVWSGIAIGAIGIVIAIGQGAKLFPKG
jgi:hypothetical protein